MKPDSETWELDVVDASKRVSDLLARAYRVLGYVAFGALALHHLLGVARRQGSSAGFDFGLRSGIRLAHIDPEAAQRLVDDEREAHERSEHDGAGVEHERQGVAPAAPVDAWTHTPFQEQNSTEVS